MCRTSRKNICEHINFDEYFKKPEESASFEQLLFDIAVQNPKELKVGYFGLTPNDVERYKGQFASLEMIRTGENKQYDFYIIDISYASRRVIDYIYRRFPSPMAIISWFGDIEERVSLLPKGSYLALAGRDELGKADFPSKLETYLKDFAMKRWEYANSPVMVEIQRLLGPQSPQVPQIPVPTRNAPYPTCPRPTMDVSQPTNAFWSGTSERQMEPGDIWKKWKGEMMNG